MFLAMELTNSVRVVSMSTLQQSTDPTKLPPMPPHCSLCRKRTLHECGHVMCPNRRDLTASPGRAQRFVPSSGMRIAPSYFTD